MTDSFSQNNESQTQGTPASAPSTAPQNSYWGNPPQTPLPNRMPGQPGSYPPYQAPRPVHPSAAAPAPNPQQPNQGANPYVQPAQTAAPYTQPNSYQQPTQQAPTQQPTHQQTQQHVQPNTQPNQQPSEPPVWQPTQQQEQPSFRQPAEQVAEQSIPQSTYTQTPPPAAPVTPQKKRGLSTGVLVTVIVLAILLASIGGCAALWGLVNNASTTLPLSNIEQHPSYSNSPHTDDETMNSGLRYRYLLEDNNYDALTTDELSKINTLLKGDDLYSTDEEHQPGVYYVGKDIPAGLYWVDGDETEVTYYFKLKPTQDGSAQTTYTVSHGNSYYGHNIVDVAEGDVLIVEEEALPLDQMNEKFTSPYKSGVYRVGADIPAGTYTLSAGKADDYYGYYVMKDLSYNEDSYLDQGYFMNVNEHPTITLEEGTYIELYNLTMKPANVTA